MQAGLDALLKKRLAEAGHVLIASHVRPDGDAIGSLIAMGLTLQGAGKQVQMVLADAVPSSYRHLGGSDQIRTKPEGEFDTFIVVDCADFKRVGQGLQSYGPPDINIDHHITNEEFGKLNLIDPQAVATSSILADSLPQWGFELTREIAAALMVGIVTDTLGFRTSNMNPKALRQAAGLMEIGVDLSELYNRYLVRHSFQAARYWGAGLSSLDRRDGLVWGTLTLADRKASGYHSNDDADLINVISSIDESAVAMIFVEQHDNRVKISWRASEPGIDVSRVATHFGGGGHQAAAGADVEGKLSEIQSLVLTTTQKMLEL
jgi:phosphoesterase RecJ-like protein